MKIESTNSIHNERVGCFFFQLYTSNWMKSNKNSWFEILPNVYITKSLIINDNYLEVFTAIGGLGLTVTVSDCVLSSFLWDWPIFSRRKVVMRDRGSGLLASESRLSQLGLLSAGCCCWNKNKTWNIPFATYANRQKHINYNTNGN